MNVLRRIERVCWRERVTNEEISRRLQQVGVLDVVRKRQEECRGKLNEMGNGWCTKKAYEGVVDGRRLKGRPRLRWTDNVK